VTRSVFSDKYTRFRRLLIEARKAAGLTQVELAARLARPQSYVSKYERGERRIDVVEFLEIAEVLDVDPADFLKRLSGTTEPAERRGGE
jgi:transcriptional regulator with XRE-family HTH domain